MEKEKIYVITWIPQVDGEFLFLGAYSPERAFAERVWAEQQGLPDVIDEETRFYGKELPEHWVEDFDDLIDWEVVKNDYTHLNLDWPE